MILLQDARGELPPNFILDHDPLAEMPMSGPVIRRHANIFLVK